MFVCAVAHYSALLISKQFQAINSRVDCTTVEVISTVKICLTLYIYITCRPALRLIRNNVLMRKNASVYDCDYLTSIESVLHAKLQEHALLASDLRHHHCHHYPLTFLPSHSVCPLTVQALTCWLHRSPALFPGQCSGWQPPALVHDVSFPCICLQGGQIYRL